MLRKLTQKELVYDQFSPFHLKRELERHLWARSDHVATREVANAFDTYLFLPRLLHRNLLAGAIGNAFNGGGLLCEFFGYAEGFDEERNAYLGLCTTQAPTSVTIGSSLLVKPDVAMAQATITAPHPEPGPSPTPVTGGAPLSPTGGGPGEPPPQPVPVTRFFGSVGIAPQKVSSSIQKVVDEVIQHLSAKFGTRMKISLEIEAENESGFDEATVRTVSENANTLGFTEKGFE